MNTEAWFTVRDIERNVDIIYTTSRKKVAQFLSDKNLDKFRVDSLEYVPKNKEQSAKEFMKLYQE